MVTDVSQDCVTAMSMSMACRVGRGTFLMQIKAGKGLGASLPA
jgi:hypothetical protein